MKYSMTIQTAWFRTLFCLRYVLAKLFKMWITRYRDSGFETGHFAIAAPR